MPKKIYLKPVRNYSYTDVLRRTELGYKQRIGYRDDLCKKLVTSLESNRICGNTDDGGIFNLEFSPDGSILAAACERKSILLYDSLTQKKIKRIPDAHHNCVNLIKFIDSYTFASGSDDNTINTWDMRFLKSSTRTLRGHANWVKNIEYSQNEHRLVTSAFDGSIYSWDLNNYTENNVIYEKVFVMDGLMRMKLTPDSSKMVICTTSGYLLIVNNLHLESLYRDLHRFKPNLYRLMQISQQTLPAASHFSYLFSPDRQTNRIELVSDFPNESEVISSLQIHPMGWCALTRNINNDELAEWTCIHDIQERSKEEYENSHLLAPLPQNYGNHADPNDAETAEAMNRNYMDLWMGFVTNQSIRAQRMLSSATMRFGSSGIRTTRAAVTVYNSGILSSAQPGNQTGRPSEQRAEIPDGYCKIIENLPRLTHYIEEPNVGKGFIKELCFSPDGRVICSPYHAGVRLLSFNPHCSELSNCVPTEPQQLHKLLHFKDYHPEIVVSCRFNPYHSVLVSGCLGGHIVWYQPVF